MTLQARKLNLIQELLGVTDVKILSRVEACLKTDKTKTYEKSLKPMSMNEFIGMIEKSREDVRNGRVVSLEDVQREVTQW